MNILNNVKLHAQFNLQKVQNLPIICVPNSPQKNDEKYIDGYRHIDFVCAKTEKERLGFYLRKEVFDAGRKVCRNPGLQNLG